MNDVIRARLRAHINEVLCAKGEDVNFTDADLLIESGKLASLDAAGIVIFLEQNYGIDFSKISFDQSRIESIDAMASLIDEAEKANFRNQR